MGGRKKNKAKNAPWNLCEKAHEIGPLGEVKGGHPGAGAHQSGPVNERTK